MHTQIIDLAVGISNKVSSSELVILKLRQNYYFEDKECGVVSSKFLMNFDFMCYIKKYFVGTSYFGIQFGVSAV